MATSSSATAAPASNAPKVSFMEIVKPFLAPYYLTVAALLGAITAGFAVVVFLLLLVAANYNLLGAIE